MKNIPQIPILLFFLSVFQFSAPAQTPYCEHVAVWDLTAQDKDRDIAQQVADEIEGLLIEIPGCIQIEQRYRASLRRAIADAKGAQTANDLPKKTEDQLKTLEIRYVIFGKIIREESVKTNILIDLRLDELATHRLVGRASIRLSGAETLTENLQSSLRPHIYKLVGATPPPPPTETKDPAWEKAKRIDTRPAYEAYLRECTGDCPNRAKALACIQDEKAWEEVKAIQRAKPQMNSLIIYMRQGHTRHLDDRPDGYGARTLLGNHYSVQRKIARSEWVLGASIAGAGVISWGIGWTLEDQSKADYAVYRDHPDDGDLLIYGSRSRADYLDKANSKKVTGEWLQAGGYALLTCGASFLVKRLCWTKTLRSSRAALYRPTLTITGQPGMRSNSIGLGLRWEF